MSKYTTQLRYPIEAGVKIFDFDYPIFDENYRSVLETKFLDAYYFSEIGFETLAMFKHFLKSKMNRIMPYYNQMYQTENLITKENYNKNLDSIEKHTKTVDQTSSGESGSNNDTTTTLDNQNVFSDTPSGNLGGEDYATNITEDNGTTNENQTGSSTSSGTANTTEEYTTELLGGGGVRYNSDILMEWRKTFLRLDDEIIKECRDLFMNVY